MTEPNVGTVDMNLRGLVGTLSMAFSSITFLALPAPARFFAGFGFVGLAVAAFVTAYRRRCPVYGMLGLSTAEPVVP